MKKPRNHKFRDFIISDSCEETLKEWLRVINSEIIRLNSESNLPRNGKLLASFQRSFDSLVRSDKEKLDLLDSMDFQTLSIQPFESEEKVVGKKSKWTKKILSIFEAQNELITKTENQDITLQKIDDLVDEYTQEK